MKNHRRPIRRIGDNPSEHFTIIPNDLAREGELSSAARSVAMYLWSHQDGWKVSAKSIAEALHIDRGTAGKALRALSEKRWIAENGEAYFLNPARRFTEDEHAELRCRENPQPPDDAPGSGAGKIPEESKSWRENPATPLWENPALKNTKPNTTLKNTTDNSSQFFPSGDQVEVLENPARKKTSDVRYEQRQEAIARGECPQCGKPVTRGFMGGYCDESCFHEYYDLNFKDEPTPVP